MGFLVGRRGTESEGRRRREAPTEAVSPRKTPTGKTGLGTQPRFSVRWTKRNNVVVTLVLFVSKGLTRCRFVVTRLSRARGTANRRKQHVVCWFLRPHTKKCNITTLIQDIIQISPEIILEITGNPFVIHRKSISGKQLPLSILL